MAGIASNRRRELSKRASAACSPSWEEVDAWLNAQHASSTIPDWYERAEQFISDQRRVMV